MIDLKNLNIILTGATGVIGNAILDKLILGGSNILASGTNEEKLKNIKAKYKNVNILKFDISDHKKIDDFIEDCNSILSNKIDVLINNASILGEMKTLEDYNYETWKNVININMNHQYYLTKNFLPLIKNSKKGSIINVSSSVGRFPREKWGAYSVSKVGLEALTEIFSQELKEVNIIVNSVNPGGTATDMRREAYPDEDQGQLPSPIDILPIFIYLASDDATESGMKFNAREYIGSMEI